MIDQKNWIKANQELVAKTIGELTFEQVLKPTEKSGLWELVLSSGVKYSFSAWMSTWEHLRISPNSILRNGAPLTSAAQFFIDSSNETKMDDIILGNFLEEMNNTLYADLKLIQKNSKLSIDDILDWDGEKLQAILNGHPKILLNKGRMGWGAQALEDYSPENEKSFKLHWVLLERSLLEGSIPAQDILDESFTSEARTQFLKTHPIPENFCLVPVHPWQWDRFISIQFAGLIAQGSMISLGEAGDNYRPQISLRTLSNVDRPEKVDIKLPLSILNTSCIRGLPAKTISIGKEVSEILSKICREDSMLKNVEILNEKAGVAFIQPDFAQIKDAPYRYHEYFGAVWRESAQSKIQEDEKAIITASLFHQDHENKSLIGAYILKSGLSKAQWLKQYFQVVVIPLYHLQLQYGVGMVAHGQNIILTLKNYVPTKMILKDFQGDLRLLKNLPPDGEKYLGSIASQLTRLPANYLIHDLITGHFITVLRFISETMQESDNLTEKEFYQILSKELQAYSKDKNIAPEQNLLAPTFERVLLNKVRFSIGYSDSAARPLPMVGGALKNPMYPLGEK